MFQDQHYLSLLYNGLLNLHLRLPKLYEENMLKINVLFIIIIISTIIILKKRIHVENYLTEGVTAMGTKDLCLVALLARVHEHRSMKRMDEVVPFKMDFTLRMI